MAKEVRLAKFIASAGIVSRRQAEELIQSGRIKINGTTVSQQGLKIDPEHDIVEVDGVVVKNSKKPLYLLLNKPAGYICSMKDPQGRPTVTDLISIGDERVYPVGRLDYHTEGLLLLTNDGDFANKMIHPRYQIKKRYRALVEGCPDDNDISRLEKGVVLEDGLTAPARVEIKKRQKDCSVLEIEIHEGKKRQVRRMLAAVGHPVKYLERISFSFLTLDGVARGQYRFLSEKEVYRLTEDSD
ncbi:MAG: pseudouridine synthase [Syntrophomonadaceae bacterium]|jgi:23S rRNA pseudouridine2605 synthase